MNFSLFSGDGIAFLFRWVHFLAGITWIGHLYYFNFTQTPFFAEIDANAKSLAIQKLVPRALWWFRWGAMFTLISGLVILENRARTMGWSIFASSWGVFILSGFWLALLMWFNVWFVIWPKQKKVIQNAVDVASGKPANPDAAASALRASIASRHNVLFSMPMLFFMGAATHLPVSIGPNSNFIAMAGLILISSIVLEFNALKGKLGPLASVPGVIHMGLILTLVYYFAIELLA